MQVTARFGAGGFTPSRYRDCLRGVLWALGDVCPGQRDMLGFALQLQPGRMPRTF
jgi:hypothetical protein